MRVFVFFVFVQLFAVTVSCEDGDDVAEPKMVFTGVVRDGDSGLPIAGAKVKIDIISAISLVTPVTLLADSATSDAHGKFTVDLAYDAATMKSIYYRVSSKKDFYGLKPDNVVLYLSPPSHRTYSNNIDLRDPNVLEIVMLETADVRLVSNKLDVEKADTLFFRQVLTTPEYSGVYLDNAEHLTKPMNERFYQYFASRVTKTTFHFRIKKSDGTETIVSKVAELERKTTKTLVMDF